MRPPSTEIYTLSLHDALPISHGGATGARGRRGFHQDLSRGRVGPELHQGAARAVAPFAHRADRRERSRSEEHTSELQSHSDLVCRLLLEKKKQYKNKN